MNLIFAKLFEEYLRKNDSPTRRITIYISIFYFFLSSTIILPLKTLIDKRLFNDQIYYGKSTIMLVTFGLLVIITFFVHYIYIKNEYIYELTESYRDKKINKTILYLIIVLAPVSLLTLAGLITVLINGGEILGSDIKGFLE